MRQTYIFFINLFIYLILFFGVLANHFYKNEIAGNVAFSFYLLLFIFSYFTILVILANIISLNGKYSSEKDKLRIKLRLSYLLEDDFKVPFIYSKLNNIFKVACLISLSIAGWFWVFFIYFIQIILWLILKENCIKICKEVKDEYSELKIKYPNKKERTKVIENHGDI